MTGEITARDLAFAHFLVASSFKVDSTIKKSSTLHFLIKQLNTSLIEKSPSFKGAFVAYWLTKQQPFEKLNNETAVIVGTVIAGKEQNIQNCLKLKHLLKSGDVSISNLQAVLET